MMWSEDGRLILKEDLSLPVEQRREVSDPDVLITRLASLEQVRAEYLSKPQSKEMQQAVKDKDQQIAWVKSRLPFKLYSSEELEALFRLFRSELLTGIDDGEEHNIGGIRVRWLTELSCWGVHEPKFINPQFLEPHPFNSAIYGENEDVSDLVSMIAESRWIKRLTINLKGQILAGNRRLLASQQLDWQEPVEIEIVRLSEEKEIELLVLDNASREKTTEQRVREADVYVNIPGWLEKQRQILRQKHGTASKNGARAREILAKKVGIGSGYTYDKARQVCQAITFFEQQEDKEIAENLRQLLNEKSVDAAHKEWERLEEKLNTRYRYTGLLTLWAVEDNQSIEVPQGTELVIAREVDSADSSRVACRLPDRARSLVMVPRSDLELQPSKESEGKILPLLGEQTLQSINKAVKGYLDEMPNPLATCELVEEFYAIGNKAAVACVAAVANRWPAKERTEELRSAIAAAFVAAKPNYSSPPSAVFKARDTVVRRNQPFIKGEILCWHHPLNQWYVKWTDGRQDTVKEADLAPPPIFVVGDVVAFLFRDGEQGVVEDVRWLQRQGWMVKVKNGDKAIDVPESHLEPGARYIMPLHPNFRVHDWVSDGNSWGIVKSIEVSDIAIVEIRLVGMGEEAAPLADQLILKADEISKLKKVRFDPYNPPKYPLRCLKVGDFVCPAWEKDKANQRLGEIKGYEQGEFIVALLDGECRLKDKQLTLIQPQGVTLERGDRVKIALEADLPLSCSDLRNRPGKILNIYRTCADILLDGNLPEKACRLLLEWLEPLAPSSFLDCASVEALEDAWKLAQPIQKWEMVQELWEAWHDR